MLPKERKKKRIASSFLLVDAERMKKKEGGGRELPLFNFSVGTFSLLFPELQGTRKWKRKEASDHLGNWTSR